jgi:uncharacterized phage-associated protein
MKTNDQILKIRAALIYVLKSIPEGVDYIKLFKILYYAQQRHLITYGRVVIEDSFNAIKHGPAPAFLYKSLRNLVNSKIDSDSIKMCVEGINFTIKNEKPVFTTTVDPDLDELSISDRECLDISIEENKTLNSYDLSEKSHTDKAWIKAYKRYQKDPELGCRMTAIDIAEAGGAKRDMINYIRENQMDKFLFSQWLQ